MSHEADESIDKVREAVSAAAEIIKIAKDNPDAAKAGQTAAKSLDVLSSSLYHLLSPLRVLNFAAARVEEYFEKRFGQELAEKLASVPNEDIVIPKSSIAGPALQGIADTIDEPELRRMYIELVARAMDNRGRGQVHPAFTEIVRQISSDEVEGLNWVLTEGRVSAAALVGVREDGSTIEYEQHLLSMTVAGGLSAEIESAWVENWLRMGVVSVSYDPKALAWWESFPVSDRAVYLDREASLPDGQTLSVRDGVLQRTSFGTAFAIAVGLHPRVIT
ncbi:DUF4393 domain-containing protein [Microbacterium azadirachtae]|uniref:DUF4393 domain-containing protein n=1 Tax=Microbacterium azadirachtae TaxID=582680 RepID=UPI003F752F09